MRILGLICVLWASLAFGAITQDTNSPWKTTQTNSAATSIAATISTQGTNRVIVATIGCIGGNAVYPVSISGGGLTWTSRASATYTANFPNVNGATVWTAVAATQLTSQAITVTRQNVASTCILLVYALAGADTTTVVGATATRLDTNGTTSLPINSSLAVTATGSFLVGVWEQGNDSTALVAASGTTFDGSATDAGSGDSMAQGHLTALTSATGTTTVGSTRSTFWAVCAGAEILGATGGGGATPTENWFQGSGWGLLIPVFRRDWIWV